MNLSELLGELRQSILRDVSDAVGSSGDGALWTDQALVRYINEAQNKFATMTCILRDETTPAVTQITLVEGQEQYTLDDRVIAILGARVGRLHLSRATYGGLFSNRGDTSPGYARMDRGSPGTPRSFYTDRESGRVGLYPAPDASWAGQVLQLRVARKPLVPLRYEDLKAVPEIPEDYQLDILEWAAWRALRNHDTDGENMSKASAHKTQFMAAVKELSRQAKRLLAQDIQFDVRNNWES